jgi:hypothetical protein
LSRSVDDGNLEHIGPQGQSGKRNAPAKVARSQSVETIDRREVVDAICQLMSKSRLTLVEIGGLEALQEYKPQSRRQGLVTHARQS